MMECGSILQNKTFDTYCETKKFLLLGTGASPKQEEIYDKVQGRDKYFGSHGS